MFDAYEAINDIIDDINEDYYESCYDAIYEELCDRVDYGELTIEEAELINEAAAEKYLYEAEDVDKALEEDDDDDKKKKESDKNIKKKINRKRMVAGAGLAAALGYKYYNDANKSYKNNSYYQSIRDKKKELGTSAITDKEYKNAIQEQRKNYRSANKLGKKKIMDSVKKR